MRTDVRAIENSYDKGPKQRLGARRRWGGIDLSAGKVFLAFGAADEQAWVYVDGGLWQPVRVVAE